MTVSLGPTLSIPDDIDIAELEARAVWTKAWNVTHLTDELWKIARHDSVAAAKMILEREGEFLRGQK